MCLPNPSWIRYAEEGKAEQAEPKKQKTEGEAEGEAQAGVCVVTKARLLTALGDAMMSSKAGKGASSSSRLLEEAARAVGMVCVGERLGCQRTELLFVVVVHANIAKQNK